MFLFIVVALFELIRPFHSNTSHVLIYRMFFFKRFYWKKNSNTSHVLIYLPVYRATTLENRHSNTSHVLIYHRGTAGSDRCHKIQIHLMFLFIKERKYIYKIRIQIQIHLMFLFIIGGKKMAAGFSDSNTSHVLIYRLFLVSCVFSLTFKYISCYYLSNISNSGFSI